MEYLQAIETPLIAASAFHAAVLASAPGVLPDLFPAFVRNVAEEDPIQIKLALIAIREQWLENAAEERRVEELLGQALQALDATQQGVVLEYARQVHLNVRVTKSLRQSVAARILKAGGKGILNYYPNVYPDTPLFCRFIEELFYKLADRLNATLSPLNPAPWDQQVRDLRRNLSEGSRALIFLSEQRSDVIDVITLATVNSFSCCFDDAVDYWLRTSSLFNDSLPLADRILGVLSDPNHDVDIGVVAETAATDEVVTAIKNKGHGNRIVDHSDAFHLRAWLSQRNPTRPRTKIVIADWGIIRAVLTATPEQVAERSYLWSPGEEPPRLLSGNLNNPKDRYVFHFTRPLPAGLMYPRGDDAWRRELLEALAAVVQSVQKEPGRWSEVGSMKGGSAPVTFRALWKGIGKELGLYGMEAVAADQVLKMVGESPDDSSAEEDNVVPFEGR
jgi:hypothetical protein